MGAKVRNNYMHATAFSARDGIKSKVGMPCIYIQVNVKIQNVNIGKSRETRSGCLVHIVQ